MGGLSAELNGTPLNGAAAAASSEAPPGPERTNVVGACSSMQLPRARAPHARLRVEMVAIRHPRSRPTHHTADTTATGANPSEL